MPLSKTTLFVPTSFALPIVILLASCNAQPLVESALTANAQQTLAYSTSTSSVLQPSATLTPTDTPTNTPTDIVLSTASATIGYNFETDIQNWNTSEGSYKLANLDTTTEIVYSGNQSLRLTTELSANKEDVYRHTEVTAYFNNAIPEGMDFPGPYNLMGKQVSCFVYVPSGLLSEGNPQAHVRIFVKDNSFRNQFGDAVDILESNVERWFQLTLTVGIDGGLDSGFDPKLTNTLGIRLDLQNSSTFSYTGPIYIDECSIEYP